MKPKEILHWVAVLAFGGFGLFSFAECGRVLLSSAAEGNWVGTIFFFFFTALVAGVPLAISYFAFRREYRLLTVVVAAVAALWVFCVLIALPDLLGFQEFYRLKHRETPWLFIIELPLSLLCFFGPFYATAWFFRLCLRLADRYIHGNLPKERIA